jgi:DNA helicase-2/ATP-dependent DNA helicase PcrA
MSLSQVSANSIAKEMQIQQKIFKAIDECQNIVFNAGAGAGKTYALIESLKYIIQEKGGNLTCHNQNVICITYTNIATNEIKERLGNTKLIKVSTIHERLWDLIKTYQKQLLKIHIDKLKEEINEIENQLKTEDNFQAYRDLTDKESFIKLILENKDNFYKSIDRPAADFRTGIQAFLVNHDSLLRNISNYKSLVGKIFRINNYKNCLERIENEEYKSVVYDARYNSDRLHKMMISHDTLLEYAYKIVDKYDLIKQVVLDKHPYILIDEYQDTDEKVVKILKLLADYSDQIKHKLFIGYFGDTAQSIYETGIGNRLSVLHPDLTNISKKYNRRSVNKVLNVINKIRKDNIEQESIYSDADAGSVGFYYGNNDNIDSFIEQYKTEWNINQDNKLHCLVLTNQLVAKYNQFENVYQQLRTTNYYRNNWKSTNTEILSHELSKLGIIPNLLYRIVDFKTKIINPKTPIIDFISQNIYRDLTFTQLKSLLGVLESINGDNINDFLESIFKIYYKTKDKNYKKIIKDLLALDDYTFDTFISHMLTQLFPNIEENDVESTREKIIELLKVDYSEYSSWFNFINKVENQDVVYHTYHGTKGEEYHNVIILMQNNFGIQGQNKFSSFFTNYTHMDNLEGEELEKFTNTKNLLYVSCSRAIHNLRILYLDDVSCFKEGIKAIFGEVEKFEVKQ